ncbi:jun dimerization protein [Anaeramoeba flamelloides]|uniref:Jun dimerization protein n=1 Tax=Anaeramoeba flamelloides TaxID=1746091 RepID=A0ABQ8Y806_9EUKA|nr:jun dimerization protein [Anaeramoeba flamelloides]
MSEEFIDGFPVRLLGKLSRSELKKLTDSQKKKRNQLRNRLYKNRSRNKKKDALDLLKKKKEEQENKNKNLQKQFEELKDEQPKLELELKRLKQEILKIKQKSNRNITTKTPRKENIINRKQLNAKVNQFSKTAIGPITDNSQMGFSFN